jgi:hypothetical protein
MENEVPAAEQISAPLNFRFPDGVTSRYATNLVVQRGEHEYTISFFEAIVPAIFSPETPPPAYVDANCVARIVVAASRFPDFVGVLQQALAGKRPQPAASEE